MLSKRNNSEVVQNQLENCVLVVAVIGSVSGWEDKLSRGL